MIWAYEVRLKFQFDRFGMTASWDAAELSFRVAVFYLTASIVSGCILYRLAARRFRRTTYNRESWERGA